MYGFIFYAVREKNKAINLIENYFLFFFTLLVLSVPVLYRFIRLGRLALFIRDADLIDDLSYEKAAPTVGVGRPVRVFAEPPGADSY